MTLIYGETCEQTWLNAVLHLEQQTPWEDFNLVLEVKKPFLHQPKDRAVYSKVNKFLELHDANPLFTVAETIFPAAEYRRNGALGVYEVYPDEIYPSIKSNWGTYAYRLLGKRKDHNGDDYRPLQRCVEKMQRQVARAKGTLRGCYELATYDPHHDSNMTIGGPCLSHLSFKVSRARELHLTAIYRSHYYVERALGNLRGLACLQAFVCEQTGLSSGTMTCVSTLAQLDLGSKWSKNDVASLISSLKGEEGRDE